MRMLQSVRNGNNDKNHQSRLAQKSSKRDGRPTQTLVSKRTHCKSTENNDKEACGQEDHVRCTVSMHRKTANHQIITAIALLHHHLHICGCDVQ